MTHDQEKRQACPATSKPTSTTNELEHTTGSERIARASARYGARFGANVGFLIYAALVIGALGREMS